MNRRIIRILMLLVLAGMVFCGYQLYCDYRNNKASDKQKKLRPLIADENIEGSVNSGVIDNTKDSSNHNDPGLMDFIDLLNKNKEIIAWLTIDDTVIDYPVVQGSNNEYYLNHTAEKEESVLGALFLDYRNSKDYSDFYNVIYGHNLQSGRMFGQLVQFKDKNFFDSHKTGTLYTPNKTYRLEIFACAVTESVGDYFKYAFVSIAERRAHLEMIEDTALLKREIKLTENDKILALSTCSYEFKEARTIILAKINDNP